MDRTDIHTGNGGLEGVSEKDCLESYSDVSLHKKVGTIIKNHSENKKDVREIARNAVDWTSVRSVLDLGCGYGCFEQSLDISLDLLVGIDMHEQNRQPFLRNGRRISKKCLFKQARLPSPIDMPAESFDLVICFYSLYFFPEILPEVRRVLVPRGIFLSITHSEGMLEEAEQFFSFSRLRKLIQRFSAENGEALLGEFFFPVTYIDYLNQLVFTHDDRQDLADYIDFKKDFIARDVNPERLKKRLLGELAAQKVLRLSKNDRIFIARK